MLLRTFLFSVCCRLDKYRDGMDDDDDDDDDGDGDGDDDDEGGKENRARPTYAYMHVQKAT